MIRMNRFTMGVGVVLALALAGCGGSRSSSKAATSSPNGGITGRVAASSLPTGGGTVTTSLMGQALSAPVAADGTFTMPDVPPGVYTLVLSSSQSAGDLVVVVAGGSVTNVGVVALVGAGQVSGLVTDAATGAPIAGATVTVNDASTAAATAQAPPIPVFSAITDGKGSYVVDGLPASTYLITIGRQGYATGTLEVTVAAGTTSAGDLQLIASAVGNGTLQGKVSATNADGSTSPLGGVFVILSSGDAAPATSPVPPTATASGGTVSLWPVGPPVLDFFAYTADDGTYTITGLPAGTYTAAANRTGFQTAEQAVTITQGQATTADFTLTLYKISTGTITGTVMDASTQAPIAGASIVATLGGPVPLASNGSAQAGSAGVALPGGPGTAVIQTTGTTDANGVYTLVVPTTTSEVYCSANGYVMSEQSVTVADGATATANFALAVATTQTVTLSGTVREPAGGLPAGAATSALIPAVGAIVTITPSPILLPTPAPVSTSTPTPTPGPLPVSYVTKTDASGNYAIAVPLGSYAITASLGSESSEPLLVKLFQDTTENLILVSLGVSPL